MSNIFQITRVLLDAYEVAANSTDEDMEAAAVVILQYEDSLEDKADNYAGLIAMIDGEVDTIAREIERLTALKRTRTSLKDRLKANLQTMMITLDRPKFKTELHSYAIQKNPSSVRIVNINELKMHPMFWKEPKWDESELDKTRIKAVINDGGEVPGAELVQTESLRIR